MENCYDNLGEVIDIAIQFDVPQQQLWDPLLAIAKKDNSKVAQLLDYVETYRKPHRILRLYNEHATVGEMRKPVIAMFNRLDILKKLLSTALVDAARAELKEATWQLENQISGFKGMHNSCDHCHLPLISTKSQDRQLQKLIDE